MSQPRSVAGWIVVGVAGTCVIFLLASCVLALLYLPGIIQLIQWTHQYEGGLE